MEACFWEKFVTRLQPREDFDIISSHFENAFTLLLALLYKSHTDEAQTI